MRKFCFSELCDDKRIHIKTSDWLAFSVLSDIYKNCFKCLHGIFSLELISFVFHHVVEMGLYPSLYFLCKSSLLIHVSPTWTARSCCHSLASFSSPWFFFFIFYVFCFIYFYSFKICFNFEVKFIIQYLPYVLTIQAPIETQRISSTCPMLSPLRRINWCFSQNIVKNIWLFLLCVYIKKERIFTK